MCILIINILLSKTEQYDINKKQETNRDQSMEKALLMVSYFQY